MKEADIDKIAETLMSDNKICVCPACMAEQRRLIKITTESINAS